MFRMARLFAYTAPARAPSNIQAGVRAVRDDMFTMLVRKDGTF
jgi:hypothetical protein